jgi:hypothetical protein
MAAFVVEIYFVVPTAAGTTVVASTAGGAVTGTGL